MDNLNNLIDDLANKLPISETLNPAVSDGNVSWHIEHSLLVINGVIQFLKQADPKDYKWSFNLNRIVILSMGKIPRNRAKAPKLVQPKENISVLQLKAHLEATKNNISEIEKLPKDCYFDHRLLGHLKLEKTVKFLCIHTNHHLKIMNDIVGD